MTYLTLSDIKAQLNIEPDFTADDAYLSQLGEVAEAVLEEEVCQPLADIASQGALPAPLKQAALLLIGELYSNREDITSNATNRIPHGFQYLTAKYRKY